MSQSHTKERPTTSRVRDTEHRQPHDNEYTVEEKQSALSLSHQNDCRTRKDIKNYNTKQRPSTNHTHYRSNNKRALCINNNKISAFRSAQRIAAEDTEGLKYFTGQIFAVDSDVMLSLK